MKTLITRNAWNAIANLMDDKKRQAAYYLNSDTEDEFLEEYLKLDPEFEDVLKSEFGTDIYEDAYEGIIVDD